MYWEEFSKFVELKKVFYFFKFRTNTIFVVADSPLKSVRQ